LEGLDDVSCFLSSLIPVHALRHKQKKKRRLKKTKKKKKKKKKKKNLIIIAYNTL